MEKRAKLYWTLQSIGWLSYALLGLINYSLENTLMTAVYISSTLTIFIGILITHFFRKRAQKWGWKKLKIAGLLPRILISTLVLTLVFTMVYGAILDLLGYLNLIKVAYVFSWPPIQFFKQAFAISGVFLFWQLFYFGVSVVENFKSEEINTLKLKADRTASALTGFKRQMNPHFMFNSMNSIRALIDEEPDKAKMAITKLSVIMRHTMSASQKNLVPLKEEIELVRNYLEMEKIRFEERLAIEIDFDQTLSGILIPPLMLQTIVENGIKHGISKRKEGGKVSLIVKAEPAHVSISVINTGRLTANEGEGLGINNTKNRLALVYEGEASFALSEIGDNVVAKILIPQKTNVYAYLDN